MGRARFSFNNEPTNPQALPLELPEVEETQEPLESEEIAAECIEILDPVEQIHPMKKLESEINLKKLEPYELAKQTISDEFMEPIEPPVELPN